MRRMLLLHAYIYLCNHDTVCTFTARDRYRLHPRTWTDFPDRRALLQEADYLFKVDRRSHRPRWQPRKCNRWFSFPGRLSPLSRFRAVSQTDFRYVTFRDSWTGRFNRDRPARKSIIHRKRDYVKLRDTRDTILARDRFITILRSKTRKTHRQTHRRVTTVAVSNEYIRKVYFGGNNRSRRSVLNPNVGF